VHGATWTPQGKYQSALSFAGTSSVRVPKGTKIDNVNTFTYCAWVNAVSMGGLNDGRIFHKGTNSARKQLQFESSTTNGRALYVDRAVSAANTRTVNNAIALNQWSYVCGTYSEGAGARIYVNAVEVAYALRSVGSGATTSDGAGDLYIGNRP